jgi:putative membrane protein
MFAIASFLFAQEPTVLWNFERLGHSMFNVVVFALLGIALAIFGFKIFDKLTPGKLDEEILQKQNIAAAILAGAFILGVCIIVAACVHG